MIILILFPRKIRKWWESRLVHVKFIDYPPSNIIDKSLFEPKAYSKISNVGLSISPLKMIHAASVHYSGRFRTSMSMRFISAFVDVSNSVEPFSHDGRLYFNESESNEFQAKSTEIISVGLSIALSADLFGVNRNRIGLIEGSGKRCDFYFIKNGLEYLIESKGRKGHTGSATKDIFEKKEQSPAISPKYGFISKIPRGDKATTIDVIDPVFTPKQISRDELIRRLLIHYANISALAGFWRLSELLEKRVYAINMGREIESLDGLEIDYENILKFGGVVHISAGGRNFFSFDSQNLSSQKKRAVFARLFKGSKAVLYMEESLIKILSIQDYQSLITYELQVSEFEEPDISFSTDGSILKITPRDEE